jgi:hypothetical protein
MVADDPAQQGRTTEYDHSVSERIRQYPSGGRHALRHNAQSARVGAECQAEFSPGFNSVGKYFS